MGELDDVFAEVGLDRRDPRVLERLVEVDLAMRAPVLRAMSTMIARASSDVFA